MFSFKKPKRNLRVRETVDDDSEAELNETSALNSVDKAVKKPKKPIHQTLLSFEEELNEGDDGEVFKVKKSNQSKKIKKQLEKERKRKKEKNNGNSFTTEKSLSQNPIDDDMIIKLKNTFPILNGREAEAADPDGVSSEDEGPVDSTPRFIKQTDSVKLLLKRGSIPDAAAIHAARKQRQHLREMGENYSMPEDPVVPDSKSRLIREDDNDASDGDEERINMTVNTAVEDRLRRKAEFDAAQDLGGNESDKGEDDEWEAQQIRKGVTGAQIAAVQQENLYYQQYLGSVGQALGPQREITQLEPIPVEQSFMVFPPLPSTGAIDPQEVIKKLKDRLVDLNEVHRRHKQEVEAGLEEIESLKRQCEHIKEEGPKRAERFRFYQDLRGYVTDLVECLDEKIVIVGLLEERAVSMYSRHVNEYISRRRQDVMDQAQELAPTGQRRRMDEAYTRRVAEREGRRIRRQRARELRGISGHLEGMSSDEEVTETEAVNMRNLKDVITNDSEHVFEDVLDEFGTVRGILERFESWRKEDLSAYTDAYVNLCISKVLGPIIRIKLLLWNPIIQSGGTDFEKAPWFNSLLLYGASKTETEESLRKDPDALLVPRVVELIILRKLTQLVTECWDPLSSRQTVSLVALVTKLIQDYPTLSHKSKSVTNFFEAVIAKMKEAVESDVYIPIYPPQKMTEGKVSSFFMRQCTVAIKLLGNITRWQGLIADSVLSEIALASLLNRSLLMAAKTCSPIQAANLCQMIGNVLPRIWLQVCVHPPQLTQFLNQAKVIAKTLDIDKPLERDALERMSGVLKAASSV